jgi:hypothetical protein
VRYWGNFRNVKKALYTFYADVLISTDKSPRFQTHHFLILNKINDPILDQMFTACCSPHLNLRIHRIGRLRSTSADASPSAWLRDDLRSGHTCHSPFASIPLLEIRGCQYYGDEKEKFEHCDWLTWAYM